MVTIASNYTAADDYARESLKASAIQNTRKWNNSNKGRICQKSSKLQTWWPQPSPTKDRAAKAVGDEVPAAASREAP
jgi:hypothetical protein